jgi:chemotaxis protein MotB
MSSMEFHEEETSGSERWIVSYADLVTLLFAFFTVMYSISVVSIPKYKQVSESMSVAIGGKDRPKTYPTLATQSIDPQSPRLDFLSELPFAVTPSFGVVDSKTEVRSKINLLSDQQDYFKQLVGTGGKLFKDVTASTGGAKGDAGLAMDMVAKRFFYNQQSLNELAAILPIIFEQDDIEKAKLEKQVKQAAGQIDILQTSVTELQQRINDVALENSKLINIAERSKQQAEELDAAKAALLNGYQERSKVLNELQKVLALEGVTVEVDLKNGILRLPEALLFGSARADFSKRGRKAIEILAKNLLKVLPCYSSHENIALAKNNCVVRATSHQLESVFIEGHTDILPISNEVYKDNWDLSFRRAKNTFLEIIKAQSKIEALTNINHQPLVSFSAYAGRRPIDSNKTEAGRKKNRRIDLRLIMTPVNTQTILPELM